MGKEIVFDYSPREQFIPFHQREQRWACMVCHRRAGKTVASINELILRALYTTKKNARYAYIAPFYRQVKEIAWVYLKEASKDFAIDQRESALRVELPNGAWITLYGADNPDALRGIYLDGVILDEYGDCRPSLWPQVVLPTLSDRKGFAVFIGTPKGKNQFYQIYKRSQTERNWYSLTLKASDSGIIDHDELMELKNQQAANEFEQEFECSFTAAVQGTFYSAIVQQMEVEKKIAPDVCKWDTDYPVHVAADIGISDSTAMWFWQQTPFGLNIIDYEEHQGQPLEYYFDLLRSKGYQYDAIWLPHDAKAKTLQTGRSTVEQFLAQDFIIRIVPHLGVQHGIDAVRKILPSCKIDQNKCFAGVEALRAYRRSFSELTKSFTDKPLHDWASDGSDAFRYLSLVAKDQVRLEPPKPLNDLAANIVRYDFCLEDLHRDREESLRRSRRH